MKKIIKTGNLTKNFGSLYAVRSLDLDIYEGEIYGFIGLNGAGKTTTIRMFLGMIRPTTGLVELFGEKVSPNSTLLWSKVGFIVETATAYPELTVKEHLEASRRLYRIEDTKAVDRVIGQLHLSRYKDKKAKYLSLGNYQRLAIAKTLLHKPRLLILDEPTNGLDPAGIVEIRNLLEHLAKNENVTVFISSHILGEAYRFATKIGIIHEGILIEEVDIENLNKKMDKRLVLDATNRPALLSAVKKWGYEPKTDQSGQLVIQDSEAIKKPENLVIKLATPDIGLNKINVEKEDLERYFLDKVGSHE